MEILHLYSRVAPSALLTVTAFLSMSLPGCSSTHFPEATIYEEQEIFGGLGRALGFTGTVESFTYLGSANEFFYGYEGSEYGLLAAKVTVDIEQVILGSTNAPTMDVLLPVGAVSDMNSKNGHLFFIGVLREEPALKDIYIDIVDWGPLKVHYCLEWSQYKSVIGRASHPDKVELEDNAEKKEIPCELIKMAN